MIAVGKLKQEPCEDDDHQEDLEQDDLHFFKSLVPHLKGLPIKRKLHLRSKMLDLVLKELEETEN